MGKFLRNYGLIVLLGVAAGYGLLVAFAPSIALGPWLAYKEATKGWHEIKAGPVKGIALAVEDDEGHADFPADARRQLSFTGMGQGTLHFLIRFPEGIRFAELYRLAPGTAHATIVSPDGEEAPARVAKDFPPGVADVIIPASYKPNCPYLDVRIDAPGNHATTFRLTRLTQTRDRLVSMPTMQKASFSGVNLEAVAFRAPSTGPRQYPTIGAAIRATSVPAGQKWEWRSVRLNTPFDALQSPAPSGGIVCEPIEAGRPFGITKSVEFTKQFERVSLSGEAARYESIEEEVDFGDVPIRLASDNGLPDDHKFRLAIKSPISRTTPTGFTLSIVPDGPQLSFDHMTAGWTFACIVFRPDSPLTAGFSGTDGEVRLAVGSDSYCEISLKTVGPGAVPGQFMWGADLSKSSKSLRLKVKVQRKRYLESHPFEVVLPVRIAPTRYALKDAYSPMMGLVPVWPVFGDPTSEAK